MDLVHCLLLLHLQALGILKNLEGNKLNLSNREQEPISFSVYSQLS